MIDLRASLERLLHRIWYEGHWASHCLIPLSRLVEWEIRRRAALDLGKGVPQQGAKVWVIGGLTVGGTGKTPVLIALGEWLRHQGVSVGVISRGYRGRVGKKAHIVSASDSATDVGDEPLLIQNQLDCPVVVCRDRGAALAAMVRQFDVDVVLSDDGLQHYSLPRDLEVVVLDGKRGLGNGRIIPAGPLREPAARLGSVDWVLERNSNDPDRSFEYGIRTVRQVSSGKSLSWPDWLVQLSGRPVTAITALGQPGQFFEMLEERGLNVTGIALPDHEAISLRQLENLTTDFVLMTAKDAVKLDHLKNSEIASRLWVVEIETRLPPSLLAKLAVTLRTD